MKTPTRGESAERMRRLLHELVAELVDQPEAITVATTASDGGNTVVLTVRTAKGEVGKVIGRKGSTAQALRHILESIAAKYRQRVVLEIDDMRQQKPERYGWNE